MRFTTWNAFILSSFALVLLIIPVANADDNFVARITQPTATDTLKNGMTLGVKWSFKSQPSDLPDICNLTLMRDQALVALLNTHVVLLDNLTNVKLDVPSATTEGKYFLALVSTDGQTTFAHSDYLVIAV